VPSPETVKEFEALEQRWWHSIDLGELGVTRGYKTGERLDEEWANLEVPDLAGRSVLDIGAWDGYFSFRAERSGADHVTALDSYVWSFDPLEKIAYEKGCQERGETPLEYELVPELWRPAEMPGRRSFDFARSVLGSRVEPVMADFATAPVDAIPAADVVFFLGVLYHLKDPLDAMTRLRAVTRQVAIIETEAIHLPGYPTLRLAQFVAEDELYGDPTNWWAPTMSALQGLATAAGFSSTRIVGNSFAEVCSRPAPPLQGTIPAPELDWRGRLRLALGRGGVPAEVTPDAVPADIVHRYRAVIHAYV
jgi:tRNA (mo5U34)-methyltransferase